MVHEFSHQSQLISNVFHVDCRSTPRIRLSPRDLCPEDPRMMLTWFLNAHEKHMNNMVFFCCLLALWVSELAAFSLDIVMFCVGHGQLSHKDESHNAWFATAAAFACHAVLGQGVPLARWFHLCRTLALGPFSQKKLLYYIIFYYILFYYTILYYIVLRIICYYININ